jgi:hypothetical protein
MGAYNKVNGAYSCENPSLMSGRSAPKARTVPFVPTEITSGQMAVVPCQLVTIYRTCIKPIPILAMCRTTLR